jgi:hypothetical protein
MNFPIAYARGRQVPDCPLLPEDFPAAASRLTRPGEVVADCRLGLEDKRRILAAWLSDACAVENKPGFREWINGAVASVYELRQALKRLDGDDTRPPEAAPPPKTAPTVLRRMPRRRPRAGDAMPPCPVLPRNPHDRPFRGGQAVELPGGRPQMDAPWRSCARAGPGSPALPPELTRLSKAWA